MLHLLIQQSLKNYFNESGANETGTKKYSSVGKKVSSISDYACEGKDTRL